MTNSEPETIEIVVNGQTYDVPNTVTTEPEILSAIQFDQNRYALYWDEDVGTLGPEQRAGAWENDPYNAPPVVISDGDEFVVIPKTTTDGGD